MSAGSEFVLCLTWPCVSSGSNRKLSAWLGRLLAAIHSPSRRAGFLAIFKSTVSVHMTRNEEDHSDFRLSGILSFETGELWRHFDPAEMRRVPPDAWAALPVSRRRSRIRQLWCRCATAL